MQDAREVHDLVAQQVREFRVARGLSQEDLADKLAALGITVGGGSGITRLEKGQRAVRVDELVALAQVLEVPVQYLMERYDSTIEAQLTQARVESRAAEAAYNRKQVELKEAEAAAITAARREDFLELMQECQRSPSDAALTNAIRRFFTYSSDPAEIRGPLGLLGIGAARVDHAIEAARNAPPGYTDASADLLIEALISSGGIGDGQHQEA